MDLSFTIIYQFLVTYIDNLRYKMHFLHKSESTDSLLAWSPFACERDKYAQQYFLSTFPKQRKLPPVLLDRTVLDRTFRRLKDNQSTDCEKEPAEATRKYRAKNARLNGAKEASVFYAYRYSKRMYNITYSKTSL